MLLDVFRQASCPNTTWRSMSFPARSPNETICTTRHSRAQGDSAMRGGRTSRDGAGVSPAASISLTPRGNVAEVAFMASRRSHVARLQTNSRVSSMKLTESLRPSLEKHTTGGRLETPLKYEYGARLISPL